MRPLVLDSYGLLEWLLGQPGAPAVHAMLERAAAGECQVSMSWINLGEVSYMLARKRGVQACEDFIQSIPSLPLRPVAPGPEEILSAARIKATARLSYANAFAIALARDLKAEIVTVDPEIRGAGLAPVVWIGYR